jgi:SAM-dependent methyltransferase
LPEEMLARHEREAQFHDVKVTSTEADTPPAPLDAWVRAMLGRVGWLRDKRVLELGCGNGDLAIDLALAGADLTVLDISPRSVDITCARLKRFAPGVKVEALVAPAEATGLSGNNFEVILGNRVLHHLDVEQAAAEIARLLTPSGRALFVENSGLNPALGFARRHLTGRFGIPRFGTEDEHPLVEVDFEHLRRHFRQVELLFPSFRFLGLLDRQVPGYRFPLASRALAWLDEMIDRHLPWLRRYGYLVLISLAEPNIADSVAESGTSSTRT